MIEETRHIQSLLLADIASWQLGRYANPDTVATLPALQRGSVWKPRQIEDLWDSILNEYPIEAFLLAPFDEKRGKQSSKYQQESNRTSTHHLLDGQQRATGIAMGFFDPWEATMPYDKVPGTLWIDLALPPEQRDVAWVFRATTRSHPWGYQRSDSNKPISADKIRNALAAFKLANPDLKYKLPSELPLTHVWPWEAEVPVPLAFLIHALRNDNDPESARLATWERLQKLPLMSFPQPNASDTHWDKQRKSLETAFTQSESDFSKRLRYFMERLSDRLAGYAVPMTKLDVQAIVLEKETRKEKKDPVEILFIRANRGGTLLEGEELMYSFLKSVWKDAPKAIGRLQNPLASPARIALFCSRMVMARADAVRTSLNKNSQGAFTPALEVSQFRRYIKGYNKDVPDFQSKLEDFIEKEGIRILQDAYDVLTQGTYALPSVLAAEIAQESPDVFFLLLRWLDRMRAINQEPTKLHESIRRRVIGFVTALSWFAKDKRKAVAEVWSYLQGCQDEDLHRFFDSAQLRKACHLNKGDNLRMVPILAPSVLEDVLKRCILDHDEFSSTDGPIWSNWNRWEWLIDDKNRPSNIDNAMRPWLSTSLVNDQNYPRDQVQAAWWHFISTLMHNRSILLFAQRNQIKRWFSDFDPSLPQIMEDKNRPWDYDHIHPQRWLQGEGGGSKHGLPKLIKDWHHSIGNLRAWPLGANRADGYTSPSHKLDKVSQEEKLYAGIQNGKDKRVVSFISESDWESCWKVCVPEDENLHYYLSDKKYHVMRKALVTAIVRRLIAIYREWYDTVYIATES